MKNPTTVNIGPIVGKLDFIPPNPNFQEQSERSARFRAHLETINPPKFSGELDSIIDEYKKWFIDELNNWEKTSNEPTIERFKKFGELGVTILTALVRVYIQHQKEAKLLKNSNVQESILNIAQKIAKKNATAAINVRDSLEIPEAEDFTRFNPDLFSITPNHLLQVTPIKIARAINQDDSATQRGCPATGTFKIILKKLVEALNQVN